MHPALQTGLRYVNFLFILINQISAILLVCMSSLINDRVCFESIYLWRVCVQISRHNCYTWRCEQRQSRFSANPGQNKMKQLTPIPPKSRMKPRKSQNAPFSHSWFGGRGGTNFPSILSRIVALSSTWV